MASRIPVALLALITLMLGTTINAQPLVLPDLEDIIGSTGELDPGRPVTVYHIKSLYVNAHDELAIVSYTQQTDDGPVLDRIGWIYLSNDRRINYKMTMLTLLRDAMADPARSVSIQIVPGTENTSRRIVSAVGIGPSAN